MPLPDRIPRETGWLTPREAKKAQRERTQTELAIYRHALDTWKQTEFDQLDSQALADAAAFALHEEMGLLDYGLSMAGGSVAKVELTARKVNLVSHTNDRRLARKFGV
jgi:hypothetical protein